MELLVTRGAVDDPERHIEVLISKGTDVQKPGGIFGSALSTAACFSSSHAVKSVLEKGATTDVEDRMGRMPVQFAAYHGIDNLLLRGKAGGDSTARDNVLRRPLYWAVLGGHEQAVRYLLSINPDLVNEPDIDG
ncbi:Ankyrin Repeat [Aspergillus hancockii]|nr:Ankyrin Repeat [Aspergillus hancockii]